MKKKSLIESLKSTRKANVISTAARNEGKSTRKSKATLKSAVAQKMGKM